MAEKKIIIVGGGCAGLSAAYTLQKRGIDYVLLEASDRAGGRVGNRSKDGFTWATGAGMTEPQWETTFQYLREWGMLDKVTRINTQTYGFWYRGRVRYLTLGKGMNPLKTLGFVLDRGLPLRTYPELVKMMKSLRPYLKLAKDGAQDDFAGLMKIAKMSTEEFGRKYAGPEVTNRILNPFLGTMVLSRARDVSIAHPIALMSLMAGMCGLDGGLAVLTDTLYDKVRDHVKLNTPVEEITIADGKVTGVRTPEGFMEASQVICTTDAVVARSIIPDLPPAMREPLETVTYCSTYNYVFALNQSIVPASFLALFIPATANSILSTVFDENAGGFGGRGPAGTGLMHAFTAGWHDELLTALPEDQRRRLVIREMQRFFPEFPDEPLFTDVIRYENGISQDNPAQVAAIHKLVQGHLRDVPGLYLAGEYLFLVACTEGALMWGKKAAEMALADAR